MKKRTRIIWIKILAVLMIAVLMSTEVGYIGYLGQTVTKVKASENTCGIYYDNLHQKKVGDDEIILYSNGGKVSTPEGEKNNRQIKLYTDIKPSYLHKSGKAASGKVIAVISTSADKPTVTNGRVYDLSATNIANASIENGVITITALKEPGSVYLHVVDTGDDNVYLKCRIIVKVAPTKIELYDEEELFTKGTLSLSDSIVLTLAAKYKNGMGVFKEIDDPDIISISTDPKCANNVEIVNLGNGKYRIKAIGIINGKKTVGTIYFASNYNKKRTQIKLTIDNPAKKITFEDVNAGRVNFVNDGTNSYVLNVDKSMLSDKGTLDSPITVRIKMNVLPYAGEDTVITEKGKIFGMASPTAYDPEIFLKGRVKVTEKPLAEQKKIKVTAAKDNKTLTIKFSKGTTVGVTSYYMYYFNNQGGYQVFKVSTKMIESSGSGENT